MKRILCVAAICVTHQAHAFEPEDMIATCDAPLSDAIAVAAKSDAQSAEWNNLNLAIQDHRGRCGTPMAIACHLSDAPGQCFAETTAAIDARSETERLKLTTYADEGGTMYGAMPEHVALTTEVRAAERKAFCSQQTSDASAYIRVLGGDSDAACLLDLAIGQWAKISFSAAAPMAFSLLPPK